jgi:hypothetical protein
MLTLNVNIRAKIFYQGLMQENVKKKSKAKRVASTLFP